MNPLLFIFCVFMSGLFLIKGFLLGGDYSYWPGKIQARFENIQYINGHKDCLILAKRAKVFYPKGLNELLKWGVPKEENSFLDLYSYHNGILYKIFSIPGYKGMDPAILNWNERSIFIKYGILEAPMIRYKTFEVARDGSGIVEHKEKEYVTTSFKNFVSSPEVPPRELIFDSQGILQKDNSRHLNKNLA